jgi:hypothetical protein
MTYSWITGVEVESTHHKCTLDITEHILNPIVILKVLNGSGDNIRALMDFNKYPCSTIKKTKTRLKFLLLSQRTTSK